MIRTSQSSIRNQFLYIDPLKQGLKLFIFFFRKLAPVVFIHRSIKTRIETIDSGYPIVNANEFLYIDPLKQGLKLVTSIITCFPIKSFYT